MDKKTISHYGWVVVVSLVIAVMLAFATPFGEYIGNGVVSIAQGMVGTNSEAVKDENVENLKDKFSGILNDCTHENTHLVGVKETTCEKDGYTGDLVCKDCLAVLKEGQKQKGTIHEYGTQVVKTPSTCSTQGIAEKTCINCGHIEKVYLETVAHSNFYETGAKAATCTVDGSTPNKLCGVCNAVVEYGQTIKSTGHNVVTTPAVAATCTKSGLTEGSHCSKCNEVIKKQTIIPKAAHAEINGGTAGIHKKCKVCGVTTDTTHSYSMATLGTSTCTEGAIVRSSCNCGYYYDTQLPAKPHTEVTTPAITATCTQKGLSAGKKCSVCNEIIIPQYETSINPDNHTGSIVNVGTKEIHTKYSCCNKVVSQYHSYTTITNVKATCTTEGNVTQKCSCGYQYTEITPASGSHELTPVKLNTQYTSHYECSNCDALIMPEGAVYYVETDYYNDGDYSGATKKLVGDGKLVEFPAESHENDVYVYNGYEYFYGDGWCDDGCWSKVCGCEYETAGWGVRYIGDDESPVQILENINGTNVTSTTFTFADNSTLTIAPEIPQYVTNCRGMFSWCENLVQYKNNGMVVEGFMDFTIPNAVTDISSMFASCYNLPYAPELPESLVYMDSAFVHCHSLTQMPVIPENVESAQYAFESCKNMTSITSISHLTNLRYVNGMFSECTSLTVAPIFPSNITDMGEVFYNCISLVTYEGSTETNGYFDSYPLPTSLTRASYTFYNCDGIYSMNVLPNSISYMYAMFRDCSNLNNIYIPTNATNLSYTYYNCDSLEYCYLTDLSKIQNMSYTFANCDSFYSLDLSNSDASKNTLTDINHIAYNCPNLCYIYMQNVDGLKNMSYAFYNCTSLYEIYGTIPSSVTNMSYAFMNCAFDYDYMGSYIQINANPTNYTNCFKGAQDIAYLTGESTMLAELAATDGYQDFSNLDKIRVVVDNPMPNGATYYVQPSNIRLGRYTDATVLVGDGISTPYPTPQQGDAFVYNGYEYRYQQAINFYADSSEEGGFYDYWRSIDIGLTLSKTSISGWGVRVLDNTLTTYPTVLNEIAGEPLTNMTMTFEDCYNLTSLPSNFVIPETVVSVYELFDQCYSLVTIPDSIVLHDGIVCTQGMFWECHSLSYLPDNFVVPASVEDMRNMFNECASLSEIITINANPTYYDTCFAYTELDIYLTGTSNKLVQLADTDTNDNVHLLNVKNVVPTGATYYRGIPSYTVSEGPGSAPAIGDYTGATATYSAGSTLPSTPQTGDRFVYNGYEYAYNCYAWNGYLSTYGYFSWVEDETLGGWGVRVINTDEYTYTAPLTSIFGEPVVAFASTYEDCVNMEYLSPHFTMSPETKITAQMFDECYCLLYLPNGFTIGDSVTRTDGMFWSCNSLTSLPEGFRVGSSVVDMSNMFRDCGSLSGEIEIASTSISNYTGAFAYAANDIALYGACDYVTLKAIADTDGVTTDFDGTYDPVQVLQYKRIDTPHSPYPNNQDYVTLGTWNFPNADYVDIYVYFIGERNAYDYILLTEGDDYLGTNSKTQSRYFLDTNGNYVYTTAQSASSNSSLKFGTTSNGTGASYSFTSDVTTGTAIFKTDGSVSDYYGGYVQVVPHYSVTFEVTDSYTNNMDYVKIGEWDFNDCYVDIEITYATEGEEYDFGLLTEGHGWIDGASQNDERYYITQGGEWEYTTAVDGTYDIRMGEEGGYDGTWKTIYISDVYMPTGTFVFRTDGSVTYDGMYVTVYSKSY